MSNAQHNFKYASCTCKGAQSMRPFKDHDEACPVFESTSAFLRCETIPFSSGEINPYANPSRGFVKREGRRILRQGLRCAQQLAATCDRVPDLFPLLVVLDIVAEEPLGDARPYRAPEAPPLREAYLLGRKEQRRNARRRRDRERRAVRSR